MSLEPIQLITIWVIPIVFAITVHEAAHAYVANFYGDNTAKALGRLTLNPIKHIDILGTVVMPVAMILLIGFAFGWAKPVPIDWKKLKNPKKDMIFIAFAGPLSNLIMAVFWALVLRFAAGFDLNATGVQFVIYSAAAGIFINTILCVLNLLPIPPLDGSRMLSGVLPMRMAIAYGKLEPYGFFIIIGLIVLGVLGKILNPVINLTLELFSFIAAIDIGSMYGLLKMIS